MMSRAAFADGIDIIVATPHHNDGNFVNNRDLVIKGVKTLNEALRDASIPLTIVSGQEIRFYDSLIEDLYADSSLLTLNNSKYILIEFASSEVPANIKEMFHELQIYGLTPIIAHPERNRAIARQPKLLEELVEYGALSQVTSQSLVGRFGSKVQKVALELCERNLIHVIASDAHNNTSRPFLMKEAAEWVANELGEEMQAYYLSNAARVIHDEPIELLKSMKKKKSILYFWRR